VQGVGQHDAQDVKQAISDRLKKLPWWWILEGFPMHCTYWNAKGKKITGWWYVYTGRNEDEHISFTISNRPHLGHA
jgi:hypothetical protein